MSITPAADHDAALSTRRQFVRAAGAGLTALGIGGVLAACGSGSSASTTAANVGSPRRGGTIKLGVLGGSSSDTLDADNPLGFADFSRVAQLYDPLVEYGTDAEPRLVLAEEISPNRDATEWTIRIRSGVRFHDGRPLTVRDVLFTLRRIADAKHPLEGAVGISGARGIDFGRTKVLDPYTLRVAMAAPNVALREVLAQPWFYVVPEGYDPKKPVGTGPFEYVSFTPGSQSVFRRNPDYWQTGLPYLDEVTIVDYSDSTSQINALLSGEADAIDQVPRSGVLAEISSGGKRLVVSPTQGFQPFTMRADTAPFDDVRVRQAMRLIVDRAQMVKVVLGGHGTVADDVFSKYDPDYDSSLPQRTADPERARALLKAAGRDGLSVELITSNIAAGTVDAAQLFAQQASAAGVTVHLRQVSVTDFFGKEYLNYPFAQDWWSGFPYLVQVGQAMLKASPYNETHWSDAKYQTLYDQAIAELDPAKRRDIVHSMQSIDYSQGAYIIPYFVDMIDAHSPKIGGAQASRAGLPFNNYDIKRMWRV